MSYSMQFEHSLVVCLRAPGSYPDCCCCNMLQHICGAGSSLQKERGVDVCLWSMQDRLVDEGYNPAYGARPLRRAIMRLLEDSMAERMLAGDIKGGDSVIIDVDADGQINVLNGDKKLTSSVSTAPAGIS